MKRTALTLFILASGLGILAIVMYILVYHLAFVGWVITVILAGVVIVGIVGTAWVMAGEWLGDD